MIEAINELKRQRGAVIMAHSYQSPEIFHGVADVTGDSLALAQAAADCDAELIVLCGVHFMAETAKILAPHRTVLIPIPKPAVRWPPRSPPRTCAPCARAIRARRWSATSTPARR